MQKPDTSRNGEVVTECQSDRITEKYNGIKLYGVEPTLEGDGHSTTNLTGGALLSGEVSVTLTLCYSGTTSECMPRFQGKRSGAGANRECEKCLWDLARIVQPNPELYGRRREILREWWNAIGASWPSKEFADIHGKFSRMLRKVKKGKGVYLDSIFAKASLNSIPLCADELQGMSFLPELVRFIACLFHENNNQPIVLPQADIGKLFGVSQQIISLRLASLLDYQIIKLVEEHCYIAHRATVYLYLGDWPETLPPTPPTGEPTW